MGSAISAILVVAIMFIVAVLLIYDSSRSNKIQTTKSDIKEIQQDQLNYVKPQFKPLTQEQIDDIHSRGKITPEEQVKEWESFDLCAPGDAIGSAACRCRKFHDNCHDCLIDYANEHDEYTPFKDVMKLVNGCKIQD